MAIPEEDRGPGWLRDYGAIEADINRLADFAARLDAEVRKNYIPHLAAIDSDMVATLPAPPAEFPELCSFLDTHWVAQVNTTNNVHAFRDGTGRLAAAAQTISAQYADSDAFSAARVRDVQAALDESGVVRATAPAPFTDPSTPGTDPGMADG